MKSFGKCKCNILTPDIRKRPQNSLESFNRQVEGQQWKVTGGSYAYKYVKLSRGDFFFVCVCKFLKILMVLDKTISKVFRIGFRIDKSTQTKPIRDLFSLFTKTILWLQYRNALYIHVCVAELLKSFTNTSVTPYIHTFSPRLTKRALEAWCTLYVEFYSCLFHVMYMNICILLF